MTDALGLDEDILIERSGEFFLTVSERTTRSFRLATSRGVVRCGLRVEGNRTEGFQFAIRNQGKGDLGFGRDQIAFGHVSTEADFADFFERFGQRLLEAGEIGLQWV